MKLLDLVEALLRREPVRIDGHRAVVALDVPVDVRARFVVVNDRAEAEPMTLVEVVALAVNGSTITMDEAFVVDALRHSEHEASSSYLARALDALRAST